jgi:hypothetical protein
VVVHPPTDLELPSGDQATLALGSATMAPSFLGEYGHDHSLSARPASTSSALTRWAKTRCSAPTHGYEPTNAYPEMA